MKTSDFLTHFNRMAQFTNTDDARPILQAVHIQGFPTRLHMESSDGWRLGWIDFPHEPVFDGLDLLVWPIRKPKGGLICEQDKKNTSAIILQSDTLQAGAQTFCVKYNTSWPDVVQLLPKYPKNCQLLVNVSELQLAVKRAAIFNEDYITLKVKGNHLSVLGSGEDGTTSTECDVITRNQVHYCITIHPAFLADGLKWYDNLGWNAIDIRVKSDDLSTDGLNQVTWPLCLTKPGGEVLSECMYLCMPCRLES